MLLTDFTNRDDDLKWRIVNDDVMGGRSMGEFSIGNGLLIFTGSTNTNGGGFSSVRTVPSPLKIPPDACGLEIRSRADGRQYKCRLETHDGTYYWADFDTDVHWCTTPVPFERFQPRRRGRWLDGPVLKPDAITSLGLIIYDGEDGAFRLEVETIRVIVAADA